MRHQRGSADPQTVGTAGSGGIVALLALLGVHEWVAVGGLIISVITCAVYVWRARRTVQIAEQQMRDMQAHHKRMQEIQQEGQ